MPEEKARAIVDEFRALGLAFVEDDWQDTPDGEVYNPIVDRPNAEAKLLDTLINL